VKKERTGIRICCNKNVHFVLKKAFLHFARWLRKNYNFPKRVPVYLKESCYIINRFSKEKVTATFFAPFDKQEEPYIRIATGNFYNFKKDFGQKEAILIILKSLAHELQHYYQWIDDDFPEREISPEEEELLEEEAEEGAFELIEEYEEDKENGFKDFWFSLDQNDS